MAELSVKQGMLLPALSVLHRLLLMFRRLNEQVEGWKYCWEFVVEVHTGSGLQVELGADALLSSGLDVSVAASLCDRLLLVVSHCTTLARLVSRLDGRICLDAIGVVKARWEEALTGCRWVGGFLSRLCCFVDCLGSLDRYESSAEVGAFLNVSLSSSPANTMQEVSRSLSIKTLRRSSHISRSNNAEAWYFITAGWPLGEQEV